MDIIWLLFTHWIADFVCQSRQTARFKSEDNYILFCHCLVYGFIILILNLNAILGIIVGILHYPVDYYSSRIGKKFWNNKEIHKFWLIIGFDQFIHTAILIGLYNIL